MHVVYTYVYVLEEQHTVTSRVTILKMRLWKNAWVPSQKNDSKSKRAVMTYALVVCTIVYSSSLFLNALSLSFWFNTAIIKTLVSFVWSRVPNTTARFFLIRYRFYGKIKKEKNVIPLAVSNISPELSWSRFVSDILVSFRISFAEARTYVSK